MGKDGNWYLTIPFRFATPGALASSSLFSSVLPKEVYKAVKREGVLKQNSVPSPFDIPGKRPEIKTESKIFKDYSHKYSVFAGLQRQKTTFTGTGKVSSSYNTFRRVSANSDPEAFIHSGIVARNLAEKAIENLDIPLEVDKIVDNFLADLGF
jgi:hypothetical protein